jgi:hypothetical protein
MSEHIKPQTSNIEHHAPEPIGILAVLDSINAHFGLKTNYADQEDSEKLSPEEITQEGARVGYGG